MSYEDLQAAAAAIAERTGRDDHDVAIVLGSGLSDYAGSLRECDQDPLLRRSPASPYRVSSGHGGSLFSARRRRRSRACSSPDGSTRTRAGTLDEVVFGVRTAVASPAHRRCSSPTPRAVSATVSRPATSSCIRDHLNLHGEQPTGRHERRPARPALPRHVGGLPERLRGLMERGIRSSASHLEEGVYAWFLGPTLRDPRRGRRWPSAWGPTWSACRRCPKRSPPSTWVPRLPGSRWSPIYAAGISDTPLHHEEVPETADEARERFTSVLDVAPPAPRRRLTPVFESTLKVGGIISSTPAKERNVMKIAVCVKQIPDPATPYDLDPDTHFVVRPNDQVLDDTDRLRRRGRAPARRSERR